MTAGSPTLQFRAPGLFSSWGVIELEKATADGSATSHGYVGFMTGIASAEIEDLDGHTVVQDGIDWEPLLKSGRTVLHHPPKVLDAAGRVDVVASQQARQVHLVKSHVGVPLEVSRTTLPGGIPATRLRHGILDNEVGRALFDNEQALQKAGNPRPMGQSIDGYAKPEWIDGDRVTRSVVKHVAIDPEPRCPPTIGFELSKGAANNVEILSALLEGSVPPPPGGRFDGLELSPQIIEALPPAARGLRDEDFLVARLLKGLSGSLDPNQQTLTWAQGRAIVKRITERRARR